MPNKPATAILISELAATGKSAPEWVQLLPAGPRIDARDGRSWTFEPDALIAAFKANKAPLPIDYEHAQDHKAPHGDIAPAAGWIVEIESRAGALWGKVEWTAKAAQLIVDRAYRYLSPAMMVTDDDEIVRLAGAGLVNRPALEMTALSREQNPTRKEEQAMSLKAIAKALGLEDSADEKAILAAIAERDNERVEICKALNIDASSAKAGDIKAALTETGKKLTAALAAVEEAGKSGDADQLRKELKETKSALAALEEKDLKRDIDAALDKATAEGKITPASREHYAAMCAEKGGLERFTALAATLPVVAKPTTLKQGDVTTESGAIEDQDGQALAAQATAYKTEQAAKGRELTTMEAIEELKEQRN